LTDHFFHVILISVATQQTTQETTQEKMTVDQLKEEAALLNIDNMRSYPASRSIRDDYYQVWNKFGPAAAGFYIMPYIWKGLIPTPSDVFNG
jgi:hypothetical protein